MNFLINDQFIVCSLYFSVYVGYEYSNCPSVIWEVQATQVSGHDMSISEIGGWNLDIHHRYNFHEGESVSERDGTK